MSQGVRTSDLMPCDVLRVLQVVAGKKKRLTFFECPNDACAMLDLAKVTGHRDAQKDPVLEPK